MLDGITFIPYILWNNIGWVSLSSPRVRLSSNILATSTSMKLVRHGYKRSRVAHSWAARGSQNPSRRHHYSIHRFPPRRHRRWHSEQPEEAIDKGGRGAISSFMWCGRVGGGFGIGVGPDNDPRQIWSVSNGSIDLMLKWRARRRAQRSAMSLGGRPRWGKGTTTSRQPP
jgi:hypothetical protein